MAKKSMLIMSGDFHHPETELEQISDMTKFMRGLNKQANAAKAREVLEVADKAPLNSPSLTGVPKAPTASANTNTTQIATTAFVMNALNSLINAAPETLRTLKALADALDNDPNFHKTIKSLINEKLPIAGGTITGNLTVNNDLKVNKDLTVVGKLHATADYTPWSGVTGKPTSLGGYGITDAPTKTGSGASGTWGINVTGSSGSCSGNAKTASSCTGNAKTATNVAWSGVTGKPTSLSGYGITDAPTKTGVGASGTWGINVTGSSGSCSGNAATATTATTAKNIPTSAGQGNIWIA